MKPNAKYEDDSSIFVPLADWRNPLGVWVILGLHVFPLWLFGIQHGIFVSHLTFIPSSVQVAGK